MKLPLAPPRPTFAWWSSNAADDEHRDVDRDQRVGHVGDGGLAMDVDEALLLRPLVRALGALEPDGRADHARRADRPPAPLAAHAGAAIGVSVAA